MVAADPGALSGKSRKTRAYGVPVLGDEYLWRLI